MTTVAADFGTVDDPRPPRPRRPLLIVGAGGHAVSVANVALSAGFAIRHFIDPHRRGETLLGCSVIGDVDGLDDALSCAWAIAIGDNAARQRVHQAMAQRHPGLALPPLVHASAVVSSFVTIGDGTVVMPGAVIGPNSRIGRLCIINTRASIDHDGVMLDFASLAPAVVTGGGVRIGTRSAIGIGATLRHGLTVGDDSVIGANSYLNRDLPNQRVAYGTPAREVRMRRAGEAYL